MKINKKFKTNGKGLWSRESKPVLITKLQLENCSGQFGELKAFFDDSWDPSTDGLIYTDPNWLKEFRNHLLSKGFTSPEIQDIDYSEQGMQGDDYVSMDVGVKFIAKWYAKLND